MPTGTLVMILAAVAACGAGKVAAFQGMPLPGAAARRAPRAGCAWFQTRGALPAASSAPRRPKAWARAGVALGAKLNRQHDFGIDPNKVDALFERIEALEIDLNRDVDEKFIRGSGAGGQKINKTSSNVQLIHLPTGIQVNCQRERTREKNRFLALRDLVDKLEAKRKGGATKAEQKLDKLRKQKARRRRKTTKKLVGDSTQSSGDMSAASSASEAGTGGREEEEPMDRRLPTELRESAEEEEDVAEDDPDYIPPWFLDK